MIYFEDIIDEPILYKNTHKVEWRKIKEFLNKKVSIYLDI